MKFLFFTVAMSMLVNCSIKRQAKREELSYSYSFTVNQCSTGDHRFEQKADYCSALANEETNDGCARTERMNLRQQQGCD